MTLDAVLAALREERLLELQIAFAETPAPTFAERARAERVAAVWRGAGLSPAFDDAGNVIAFRPGRADGSLLAIAAHLDTVFQADQDVRVRRPGEWCDFCDPPATVPDGEYHGPGIGDCAAGLAAVTGLVEALHAAKAESALTILLVATVGEEGVGDLKGARALFAGPWGPRIGAFVTVDLGVRGAIVNAGVASRRFRVTFFGPGGHAWDNFGIYSPIHAAGRAVAGISSYDAPREPRVTFNVGIIAGGRSINAIPESAHFDLDLRSTGAAALAKLEAHALESVRLAHEAEATRSGGEGRYSTELLGDRPGGDTSRDHPLVQAAVAALNAEGFDVRFGPGSTDANVPMSLGVPGVAFPWGGTSRNAHSIRESFRPKGRLEHVRALARLAVSFAP